MNKIEIQCTCCNSTLLRWPYEVKIKRKGKYICTPCRRKNGEKVTKTCAVCNKEFTVTTRVARKQITCSYACSNKHFRTGENNGNWKRDVYRSTCFLYHKKECVICGENKIVTVHHYDENHENNSPENLVPLCPTHHQYYHSNFRNEVEKKINTYVNNFISKRTNPDIA